MRPVFSQGLCCTIFSHLFKQCTCLQALHQLFQENEQRIPSVQSNFGIFEMSLCCYMVLSITCIQAQLPVVPCWPINSCYSSLWLFEQCMRVVVGGPGLYGCREIPRQRKSSYTRGITTLEFCTIFFQLHLFRWCRSAIVGVGQQYLPVMLAT